MGYATPSRFQGVYYKVMPPFVAQRSADWNLAVDMPPQLMIAMLFVTLATCAAASVTSVTKVFRLPPATVFRS